MDGGFLLFDVTFRLTNMIYIKHMVYHCINIKSKQEFLSHVFIESCEIVHRHAARNFLFRGLEEFSFFTSSID